MLSDPKIESLKQLSMCNEIIVLGRYEAEEFECFDRWGCISIANTADEFAAISEANRVTLLQLAFRDIARPHPDHIAFSDDHAHEILDLVSHFWDDIETLMIHCDAGISRSSATAAAIARLKFGDGSEFFEPPYEPNPRVYQVLLEVSGGRADFDERPIDDTMME